MDENYYDDSPPADASTPGPEKPKEESHDGQVATLPASICPGMKAGEELVLHIDKVLEDEYVVSYAPKESESESSEQEKPTVPGRDEEMASMME